MTRSPTTVSQRGTPWCHSRFTGRVFPRCTGSVHLCSIQGVPHHKTERFSALVNLQPTQDVPGRHTLGTPAGSFRMFPKIPCPGHREDTATRNRYWMSFSGCGRGHRNNIRRHPSRCLRRRCRTSLSLSTSTLLDIAFASRWESGCLVIIYMPLSS